MSEGASEAMGQSAPTATGAGTPPGTGTFLGNLSQAVSAAADSKLRERSPEKFQEALQAIFQGHDSLRIPVEQFNGYFDGKSMDPAAAAGELGATNYPEAATTPGASVEVPTENFLSKLDPEHQQGLLPDVVDPRTGQTIRQHQADLEELQQWISGGGLEKWQAELEQSDPETAATPEWQTIQGDLRQRYTDAGQTPEAADTLATRVANIVGNLARKVGMQPSELLDLYTGLRGSKGAPIIEHEEFVRAEDQATHADNAENAQASVIPGNGIHAPAVALNPHGYAYLRKLNVGLEGPHFNGIYLAPGTPDILEYHVARTSGGLSDSAKASVAELMKTIRENPSARGGTIIMREGLPPWEKAVTVAEERVHDFQASHPVAEDWLRKHSEVADKAELEMKRQGYSPDEWADEISAKLLAGDRFGLSVKDAESLRDSYLEALEKKYGKDYPNGVRETLPDQTGGEERLRGQQFRRTQNDSGTSQGENGPGAPDRVPRASAEGVDTGGIGGAGRAAREEIPGASREEQGRGGSGSQGSGQEGVGSSAGGGGGAAPDAASTTGVPKFRRHFVETQAAEQGMTPEAFSEKYRDSLSAQDGKEFSPAQFYADALTEKIAADPASAEREYNGLKGTDGGRVLDADKARELSEFYRADRTRAGDVHQPVVDFIQSLYEEKLKTAAAEGRKPAVVFTAGGTGAGKSSSLDTPEGRALHSGANIVYEGTLSWEPGADKNIQRALDAGGTASVIYTYRDPVEALTGGVLPRAVTEGRTVPLGAHFNSHVEARKTIESLRQKYAGNPRVKFVAIDNTRGKGNTSVVGFDALPSVESNGLKEKLRKALDEEFKAGRISEAILNRTDPASDVRNKSLSPAEKPGP